MWDHQCGVALPTVGESLMDSPSRTDRPTSQSDGVSIKDLFSQVSLVSLLSLVTSLT